MPRTIELLTFVLAIAATAGCAAKSSPQEASRPPGTTVTWAAVMDAERRWLRLASEAIAEPFPGAGAGGPGAQHSLVQQTIEAFERLHASTRSYLDTLDERSPAFARVLFRSALHSDLHARFGTRHDLLPFEELVVGSNPEGREARRAAFHAQVEDLGRRYEAPDVLYARVREAAGLSAARWNTRTLAATLDEAASLQPSVDPEAEPSTDSRDILVDDTAAEQRRRLLEILRADSGM